jgi:cell wall assembly regulator SMI1
MEDTVYIFPAATPADIEAIEAVLNEHLPQDLATFLMLNYFKISFDGNFECSSARGMLGRLQSMNKMLHDGVFNDGRVEYHKKKKFGNWDSGAIQEVWWSEKWLPVSVDSCGNMKCIDFAPTTKGQKYQIVSMEVQDGQGPFLSDYTSFGDYLTRHLYYLENNKWQMEEDWKGRGMISIDRYLK